MTLPSFSISAKSSCLLICTTFNASPSVLSMNSEMADFIESGVSHKCYGCFLVSRSLYLERGIPCVYSFWHVY